MSYEKALELIEKEKREKTGKLNLKNCGLTELPEEVSKLDWLVELNLGNYRPFGRYIFHPYDEGKNNNIEKIDISLGNLKKLKKLTLGAGYVYKKWNLHNISFLEELKSLEHLYIIGTNLRNIKPIQYLKKLKRLDLSFTLVKNLRPLKDLNQLQSLSLYKTKINSVDLLENLNKLRELAISGNKIDKIESIQGLKYLRELSLYDTKVWNLDPLRELINLRQLFLPSTLIDNIEPLRNLTKIRELSLYDTQIEDLSPLRNLVFLESLDISNTKVKSLSFLKGLLNLTFLNLENTDITDISILNELESITTIGISNTLIEDLYPLKAFIEKNIPVIVDTDHGHSIEKSGIYALNCPLTNPPLEIVQQGNEAILRYFAEKEKGTQKLMEAKLLIVGQGGAGKTSLKKKLHDVNAEMPAKGDTTRGIVVSRLDCKTNNGEDFRLNIWDFGGQNVQHYAHQFFLTGSSLYALVTNEREQNPNFQYWLNIIEMMGAKSPVLIVQNEIAGHSEPIKNAAAIRERFGNVVNPFQQVDLSKAATDKRFDQLKEEIIHQALRLPHIGKEYPTSYVRVREALENEAKAGKHYISWSAYKDLCTAVHVDDADVMQDIATTFTILGVCLHFKDDMVLKKFVFLNPKWIIDALFQLIYHEKVIAQKGKFSELDAEEIWAHPDYEGMEDKLIRIMENFELCYRMKDSDNYIVPQRLPAEDESYGWNEPRATKVQYAYKFMPKGLITRLTCRLHEKIEGENVWNDAVIFAMPKARAFVREVYAEECIAIEVSGEKRGDLLNRILDEVDDIHRKSNFENLQVEKLVPCSCAVCSEAKTPHFFDYDYLIELLEDGEYDERCKESKKKVDIREVLLKTGIDFKKHSRRSSFAEASADKWGDWGDLERRGQGEQVILLQKKLNFLEQELIKENDAAKRFTIQEQIEEIKASLRTIREE